MPYLVVPKEDTIGGRRMRGGDLTEPQKNGLAAIATTALITAAVALTQGTDQAVATLVTSGAGIAILSSLAEKQTEGAAKAVAAYLRSKGGYRVVESVGRMGKATVSLADQSLGLAFALIRLPVSFTTAAVGITGQLIRKGADTVQAAADKLDKPETHIEQADLIIQNGTLAFATALAALTASGALPIMTVFSFMLWTGKLYMSPAGRAVGIIELYMWWINQTDANKSAFATQAKNLVSEASKGGKVTLDRVGPKVKEAILTVGSKLKGRAAEGWGNFEAGFRDGIQNPDSPLITALSLGFCRAAGIYLDEKAPEPAVGENKDDLKNLAETLFNDAFVRGPGGAIAGVDSARLAAAINELKRLRDAAKSVEEAREQLRPAKAELAEALKAAGVGAAPVAAAVEGARAAKASKAPTVRTSVKAAVVEETRARGKERVAAAEEESAAAVEERRRSTRSSLAALKRKAVTGAEAPTGGRRRKTRRKRLVRRVTKKVKGFYY
jgi:hypothetical protein